ncbi:hypothetical protein FXO37_18497 [Capsicum annuum]|nr:hypothetical protein FXO37_18497 [Capsicum annuum]
MVPGSKESGQTRKDSQNLGFEEAAQTQKSTGVEEEVGTASTGVEEKVGGVFADVGEDFYGGYFTGVRDEVGSASTGVGEEVGGFFAATASEFSIIESDWESTSENSKDSGYEDLFDKIENEYDSDVHEEVRTLREGKRAGKPKKKKRCPRAEGVAAAPTLNVVSVTGRGRGSASVAERDRGTVGVAGRGKGSVGVAGRGRETFVATISNIGGVAGRSADISAVVASNVGGVGGRAGGTTFKRPSLVGMGVLHTQNDFIIHNPGMPLNSSIVIENLGHHKLRSGVK